jgi:hypothetical protein
VPVWVRKCFGVRVGVEESAGSEAGSIEAENIEAENIEAESFEAESIGALLVEEARVVGPSAKHDTSNRFQAEA